MSSRLAPRRLVAAALVVAGLAVAGWSYVDLGTTAGFSHGPAGIAPTRSPGPTPASDSTRSPRTARPSSGAGVPTRLLVPALDIDAPVVGIGVRDGTLVPPDDPQVLGWWRDGARPGARTGGALITGHTVHTGGGAMDDLEKLVAGDAVTVRTRTGRVGYRVSDVTIYRKARLAKDAARIFSQDRPGRLVLVTCEDWDGTQYLSNVVVIGRPAGGPGSGS